MLKAYKYRLYPTEEQKKLLETHFNGVRLIYNLALEVKTTAWASAKINISRYDLQKQATELKREYTWLQEINSQSIQGAILNLDMAYSNFFKGRAKFPNFKCKTHKQSFQCPQNVSVENDSIFLPKFKEGIKIALSRSFDGNIKTVTISKTTTNKYFASILVDNNNEAPKLKKIKENTSVGIDLGIKSTAVLSDGTVYENPKHLKKSLQRLKILQKRLSKKKKGSNNRNKARQKVALLHEKITNQRKDFLHKVTTEITNRFDTICIEDLHVKGMVKNHKLAQSISDAGMGMFEDFIRYKSEWKGKNVLQIGRFDPSSKIHNKCGHINNDLTLADREWTCPNCGELVNRDLNAAINIKNFALRNSGVERSSVLVEPVTLVTAMKQENKISSN